MGDVALGDGAHPEQLGVEVEAFVDVASVSAFAVEGEEDVFVVAVFLADLEFSELEQFRFHGIANDLPRFLNHSQRVVGCHVGKSFFKIFIFVYHFFYGLPNHGNFTIIN